MDPKAPLAYYDAGTGPAVVLVHGFCEDKSLWKGFEDRLLLRFRVITPDLPGHGESVQEKESFSVEYFADKVYELLVFLNINECVMVGHSLGGYVTLAFAERYPQMLKGFGLFHSTAFADSEEKKINRDRTIEFIRRHGMGAFADSFVAPLFYSKNRERLKNEITAMQTTCRNTRAESAIATTLAMRDRKDRILVLREAQVPVLFIIGKDDNAVPLEKSLEQCYLPEHNVVHVLPEVAHMGMFEKQQETEQMLEEFLVEVFR